MAPAPTSQIKICKEGGKGTLLPAFESEHELNDFFRAFIYGVALTYFFLGVSIVSDMFMGSIERITARKVQRLMGGRMMTVSVWNPTVSTLSLMALGSSAPEILLAVTELFGNNFHFGELGPSTIVGSASFNLLMIVALCMVVIPNNEVRKVQEVPVFFITSVFMFVAYIWLVIMVAWITPGIIEIWEAAVTLALLPLLVLISYLADVGFFGDFGKNAEISDREVSRVCELLEDYSDQAREAIRSGLGENRDIVKMIAAPTPEEMILIRNMFSRHLSFRKARQTRRSEALNARKMTTVGRKIKWDQPPENDVVHVGGTTGKCMQDVPMALPKSRGMPLVQFASEAQHMSESLTEKPISIFRSGDLTAEITVCYEVIGAPKDFDFDNECYNQASFARNSAVYLEPPKHAEGDRQRRRRRPAIFGHDMAAGQVPIRNALTHCVAWVRKSECLVDQGTITFEAGQSVAEAVVSLPSTVGIETNFDEFVVDLTGVLHVGEVEEEATVQLGDLCRTLVAMCGSDMQGRLGFGYERLLVAGDAESQTLQVMIERTGGCQGTASCTWRTERLSAVPGYAYTEVEGTIEFAHGVTEAFLEVEVLPRSGTAARREFLVILENLEGADFDPHSDGGVDTEILTIEIGPAALNTAVSQRVTTWLDDHLNFDEFRLGNDDYKDQIIGCFLVNGSLEEQREAGVYDWVFHVLSLPWRFVFMLVPPATYCGGWVCFFMSLLLIAGLTAFIGDIAELFGCVIECPDLLTAISFVALGTSMPDLFASKVAATEDPTADAAIINVTGSNSVNVYLGLGLPWTIGAIYWEVREWDPDWASRYPDIAAERLGDMRMAFVVRPGDLVFAVLLFTLTAFLALVILTLRRRKIGAELGGPVVLKVSASITFVIMWLTYIALSGWWSLRKDIADTVEMTNVFAGGSVVLFTPVLAFIVYAIRMPPWSVQAIYESEQTSEGAAEPTCYVQAQPSEAPTHLGETDSEQNGPIKVLKPSKSGLSFASNCTIASENSYVQPVKASANGDSSPSCPTNTWSLEYAKPSDADSESVPVTVGNGNAGNGVHETACHSVVPKQRRSSLVRSPRAFCARPTPTMDDSEVERMCGAI